MDALYESYFLLLTSDIRFSLIRSAEALRFNNSGSALFKTHLTSDLLLLTS